MYLLCCVLNEEELRSFGSNIVSVIIMSSLNGNIVDISGEEILTTASESKRGTEEIQSEVLETKTEIDMLSVSVERKTEIEDTDELEGPETNIEAADDYEYSVIEVAEVEDLSSQQEELSHIRRQCSCDWVPVRKLPVISEVVFVRPGIKGENLNKGLFKKLCAMGSDNLDHEARNQTGCSIELNHFTLLNFSFTPLYG